MRLAHVPLTFPASLDLKQFARTNRDVAISTPTVPFQEHEILPTPHTQTNLANESKVVGVRRVHRDLRGRAARNVVA
jgi:hypothetical protein